MLMRLSLLSFAVALCATFSAPRALAQQFKKSELRIGLENAYDRKDQSDGSELNRSSSPVSFGVGFDARKYDARRFHELSVDADALSSDLGTRSRTEASARFRANVLYRAGLSTQAARSGVQGYLSGGTRLNADQALGKRDPIARNELNAGMELGAGIKLNDPGLKGVTLRFGPQVEYWPLLNGKTGTGVGAQLCALYAIAEGQYLKVTGEFSDRNGRDFHATCVSGGAEAVFDLATLGLGFELDRTRAPAQSGEDAKTPVSVEHSSLRVKVGLNLDRVSRALKRK